MLVAGRMLGEHPRGPVVQKQVIAHDARMIDDVPRTRLQIHEGNGMTLTLPGQGHHPRAAVEDGVVLVLYPAAAKGKAGEFV